MKASIKILLLMIVLGFGLFTYQPPVSADWWDRSVEDRPVLPRDEIVYPTEVPPTSQPTVTPPRQGGPQPTVTPDPGGSSNDDPCEPGETYTGDYCGWSPRIGGDNGGGNSSSVSDPGDPPVMGLSYTSGGEVGLSDIMLLSGLLCLLLYAKSKFALKLNAGITAKRRSR